MYDKRKIYIIRIISLVVLLILTVVFILTSKKGSGTFSNSIDQNANNEVNNSLTENMAQFIGDFGSNTDSVLSEKAVEYIEKDVQSYCSTLDYGYDNKYIYTWVYCEKHNQVDGEEMLSAFSIPTRFEYDKTNFTIIGYEQPGDGSMYGPGLKRLFPEKIYPEQPTSKQLGRLEMEARQKYLALNDPKYFEKIKAITDQRPEFKDWQYQGSFAGKESKYKVEDQTYYFAFITMGSGVPIVSAECFRVDNNNVVNEIPQKDISTDTYISDFDPINCG